MVLAHAENTFRKLSKALRRLPDRPSIEEVHDLRNQARRFETIAGTLLIGHKPHLHNLLKAIRTIRKAAGAVRDRDVLSQDALSLSADYADRPSEKNSVLRLLHHLHSERVRKAQELTDAVKKGQKSASARLNQLSNHFRKQRKADHGTALFSTAREGAAVMDVLLELRLWPQLSEKNLHPFRLKVKHLRDLLQMADGSDSQISADLGKTKDLIGDWHDWLELQKIAAKILTAKEDRAVLRRIEKLTGSKLKTALASAESLLDRHIWFNGSRRAA